jgi:hypothetical protein
MIATRRYGQAIITRFVRDEGRFLGIGIQVQISNRHWVLWPKAMVLSAIGKGC